MNILEKLGLIKPKTEAKTEAKTFVNFGGTSQLFANNKQLEYAAIGIVYRCIRMRADTFAKYEQLVSINGDVVDEHPIYDILHTNPYGNWSELKKAFMQWWDKNGNAYLWFNQVTNNEYVPYVLPSSFVKINLGSSGDKLINNYTIDTYLRKPLTTDEIVHSKTIIPNSKEFFKNICIGTPDLLNASLDYLQIEKESLDYYERRLVRDNTVPYVLKTDEIAEGRSRLKAAYNSVVPNAYNAIAVLGESDSVQSLVEEKKDSVTLSFETIQKTIATIWGLNMPLLTGEFANRNTADVLAYEFENNVIYPLVKQFNSDLTRYFQKLYKNDSIEIISEEPIYNDYEYYLKEMQFDVTHGIKSRNEIRLERGLTDIPDGDKYLINSGLIYAERLNDQPANMEFAYKSLNDNEVYKTVIWKRIDNVKSSYEKRLQNATAKTFKDLAKEVESNITKSLNKAKIDNNLELFDAEKWSNILQNNTKSLYKSLIESIIRDSLKDINLPAGRLSSYEKQIAELTRQSTDLIGGSVYTINDEIKSEIQKVVEDNPLVSNTELQNALQLRTSYLFNEIYTKSRANLIAETTSTFSTTASQKEVFDEEGYDYRWLSRRDGKVRDDHRAVDGKQPDAEGFFTVGTDRMKHPGGGSQVAQNARCRCYLLAGTKK